MTENDAINTDPSLTDDELDVEGHGLKEIAVGLSTAALLATGAAGAVQAGSGSGPVGGTVHAGPASISVQADPGQARDMTRGLSNQAQTADLAVQSPELGQNGGTIGNTAGAAVDEATKATESLRADPMGSVDRTVDQTIDQARDARDSAIGTAQSTAASTQEAGAAAARQAQSDADRAATEAQQQATAAGNTATGAARDAAGQARTTMHATMQQAQSSADAAKTLVVSLTKVEAGGSVDATSASGTVTVSAGGVVLGSATIKDGQAIVHFTAPAVGGHTVTVDYQGDDQHLPSQLAL